MVSWKPNSHVEAGKCNRLVEEVGERRVARALHSGHTNSGHLIAKLKIKILIHLGNLFICIKQITNHHYKLHKIKML